MPDFVHLASDGVRVQTQIWFIVLSAARGRPKEEAALTDFVSKPQRKEMRKRFSLDFYFN